MLNMPLKHFILSFSECFIVLQALGQQKVLTIKEAEQIALSNYAYYKSKASQLNASKAFLKETKTEYLPDVTYRPSRITELSTVKMALFMVISGLSVASSGPALPNQNWNAAFGAFTLQTLTGIFSLSGGPKKKLKCKKQLSRWMRTILPRSNLSTR